MSFADTLGAERLASTYFLTRLAQVRQAQQLSASEQFDLARSPLSDDDLESVINQFRDTPLPQSGWGIAEGLNELISRQPKSVAVSDLKALQTNLIARGYAPPDAEATGVWDPSWYAATRRFDRDNMQEQMEGRHWYSAPIESGVRALTNTLPSRVFQGIVGAAKGIAVQTPETAERLGLLGGAAAGAGIGTAIVPGAGTLIGAGIGAAAGFLADLFGDDEGEEDQSGAEKLIDALQPFNEYAEQGPKAFFEDLGFVLSAASMATGVGFAARGVSTGVKALQAARVGVPTLEAGAAAPGGAALANPLVEQVGAGTLTQQAPLIKAALFRPGANRELGVFGTVVRAATRKYAPGSVASLERTMLRYSPISFGQRLGPNIALKAFGGLSQAQMGARLFGGIGQGSRGAFEEAQQALEAELGRDLREDELLELQTKTGQTAIERSIAEAPTLSTGVEVPLLGDLVDLAAFVLYPQRLLPFKGSGVAKSALNVMGDTTLAPFAHAAQHLNPGLGIKDAVAQVKAWLKPLDNAWLRADYGIDREAHAIIARAYRGNAERAFRANALPKARADVIRTIRREFDGAGSSPTLERIMRYSVDVVDGLDGPSDFTGWLVKLNGKHRGIDRMAAWKEANTLARKLERDMQRAPVLADTDFALVPGKGIVRDRLATGQVTRPQSLGRVRTERAGTNVDRLVLEGNIARLERRASLYERRANRGALDPFTAISLREQARLARSEAETLRQQLDVLRKGDVEEYVEGLVVTPARTDFIDRRMLFQKRREFLSIRNEVLGAVKSGNVNLEITAKQRLANFVDGLAEDGLIPDNLVNTAARPGKSGERIAKVLEEQAKAAAKPIDLPSHLQSYADEFDRLGYKPVSTGDDVLFPDQLEQMTEIAGIGDYTRRAQVWESIGLSPKWRTDRALFRIRREHEVSELNQVFEENGIRLNGEQAMRRLHEKLQAINHDGAVLGPFRKPKEGKVGLYKVDVRDLSPNDILYAFEDVPGFTDDVARKVFGALRRGAAYGGELKLLRPAESVRAMGRAMRLNGLPGFSDLVRTWHADVPMKMSRGALRREEFNYRPTGELARSPERTRVETHLKEVASKSRVSEGQRQFGMMMLDSLAQGQVRAGRFASVDDFFRHMDAGYAERYTEQLGLTDALFKRVMDLPATKGATIAVTPTEAPSILGRELNRYLEHIKAFDGTPSWYENSAAAFNRLFGGGEIVLRDGKSYSLSDVMARVVAETSGGLYPDDNFVAAVKAMKLFLADKNMRHVTIKGGSGVGYHRYGKNVYRKIDEIFDGNFPSTEKYGPFYNAVQGRLDDVVVDRRMAILFGVKPETLTDAEREWIKAGVKALADRAGIRPGHAQERLWLAFNDILDQSENLARRRGDTELADELASIARVREGSSSDYGTLLATNERGAADLVEATFGATDESGRLVRTLFKQAQDDVLGVTQFGDDYATTMRFFRNADFSTLVHENAHMLRRLMSDEDVAVLERAYGLRNAADVAAGPPAQVISTRTKAFRDSAQAMFRRSHSEADGNGFTWDPHTGSFRETGVPGAGSAVATGEGTALLIRPGDKAFDDIDAFRAEIRKFMGQHADELQNSRMHVGGWKDDEGIHVDVSEILASREEAQRVGALRQQKAVYDLETFEEFPSTVWTRSAEERFASDAEAFFFGKTQPTHPVFNTMKHAIGALWRQMRPAVQETNAVPRSVRQLLDKTFEDVLRTLPERRTASALRTARSKQVLGGAVVGGVLGGLEGDDPSDILTGVALGAGTGLAGRAALRRTYGYLPDYLTRANTALRYTLSFTFDAGRFTEQNMIAMTKHGLPAMMSPTRYVKSREWKTPFSAGPVKGEAAWNDAVRLWDEINGTTWFQNIDDLDRRMYQSGMLGFSPRNWEIAQAFQLYQRGWKSERIREAVSEIGRYGLGRTSIEKSANFVVFPFSFSKKLLTTLGDFVLQAPSRNLLLHEGFRRYHESEFDEKVNDFLDRHLPILKELSRINNLAYGISPGRFFMQGLGDQRTGLGKAMQVLASVFVPSGAATSLQQAVGSAGDLAVHAFSPIVLTGESITRMGGMDPVTEIFRRYIPFIRELDQYFLSDDNALRSQITALKEGAEPYYQFQKYQEGVAEAKAGYDGLAAVLGYQGVDGLLQSNMGMGIAAELEANRNELAEQYPTGFAMSQQFENSAQIDQRALLDISEKAAAGRASLAEERILMLAEDVERFSALSQFMTLDPQLLQAMAAKTIRDKAMSWVADARFAELYDRFFARTYGPIRRVA